MIRGILFDVDNTLMDYQRAEYFILRQLFAENGKTIDEEALATLWELSWRYWHEQKLEETWLEEVQRTYHERYDLAVRNYCAHMREQYGLSMEVDALRVRFGELMGQAVTLYDDALPALSALKGRFVLAVASNAIAASQRARVRSAGLPVEHQFFSEEMGCIKPMPQFFEKAVRDMGLAPQECLMVGDSLGSDVAGAAAVGMKTCWLNRGVILSRGTATPDYTIQSLHQLLDLDILKGGKEE